jgi:cytochrome c5
MKSLSLIACILITLMVLVNCSPKTAKTTAKSEPAGSQTRQEVAVPTPVVVQAEVVHEDVNKNEGVVKSPDAKDEASSKFAGLNTTQKLTIFSDMAPLRVEMGKKLYTTKCNKCHDYYEPSTRRADVWVDVMDRMAPEAKLSIDQHLMVGAYLVQNAKK